MKPVNLVGLCRELKWQALFIFIYLVSFGRSRWFFPILMDGIDDLRSQITMVWMYGALD